MHVTAGLLAASLALSAGAAVNAHADTTAILVRAVVVEVGPSRFGDAQIAQSFSDAADWFGTMSGGRIQLQLLAVTQSAPAPPDCDGGRIASTAQRKQFPRATVFVFLVPHTSCLPGGLGTEGSVTLNDTISPGTIQHELGHAAFGLEHAHAASCVDYGVAGLEQAGLFGDDSIAACEHGAYEEYGNPYDTMGGGADVYSAPEQYSLGLLTPAPVTRSGTYRIRLLEQGAQQQGRALRLNLRSGSYWLEYRDALDGRFVRQPLEERGILVNWVSNVAGLTGNPNRESVLVPPVNSAGLPRYVVHLSEQFSLPGLFAFTIDELDETWATVSVTLAPDSLLVARPHPSGLHIRHRL